MADKTTITKHAAGLLVQTNHGMDKDGKTPLLTTWTFTSDADAAKQRAEFADALAAPEHAELAAKLAALAPAADAVEG